MEFDGLKLEVEELVENPRKLRFFINGNQAGIGPIEKILETDFEGTSAKHRIRIKTVKRNSLLLNFTPVHGISIEIDDVPVQNSLADPLTILKIGRAAIAFFTFLYTLKTVMEIAGVNDSSPLESRLIASSLYVLPAIVMLFLFLIYMRRPKVAVYVGLVLSVLECIDFGFGMYMNPEQLRNIMSVLIFAGLRISSVLTLIKASKALKQLQ